MKRFNQYTSEGMNSKMWILPNGNSISLIGMIHKDYLLRESDELKQKYGVNFLRYKNDSDDQNIRLRALQVGFVRVNYQYNGGLLTIEASKQNWNKKLSESILNVIITNVDLIDQMIFRLLGRSGRIHIEERIGCVDWNKSKKKAGFTKFFNNI